MPWFAIAILKILISHAKDVRRPWRILLLNEILKFNQYHLLAQNGLVRNITPVCFFYFSMWWWQEFNTFCVPARRYLHLTREIWFVDDLRNTIVTVKAVVYQPNCLHLPPFPFFFRILKSSVRYFANLQCSSSHNFIVEFIISPPQFCLCSYALFPWLTLPKRTHTLLCSFCQVDMFLRPYVPLANQLTTSRCYVIAT